jgi:hypothetical protein
VNAPKLPELPEPDTRSLAYSGRDVEYIEGYESGFESALESMRSYGTACFEAGVKAGRESIFGKPAPQTQNRPEP